MNRPLNIKDKSVIEYIDYLEKELKKFTQSPVAESYLALINQINIWNNQLKSTPIDLFADKDSKEFDRAHKYFTEQRPYFEQLDYLRKLMSPEEIKEADSRRISESATAEKYIFKKE